MTEDAQIEIARDGGHVTVTGGGMLDLTNSQAFHEGLLDAAASADSVTADLRHAQFIDTAIVQDLARAAVKLRDRGKRLKVIVSAEAYPRRVLDISGFDVLMDIEVVSTAV